MTRTAILLLALGAGLGGALSGCASKAPLPAGWQRLAYIGRLDALPANRSLYRDCRADPQQPADLFRSWVRHPHHVEWRYWAIPTRDASFDSRSVLQVEEASCRTRTM